MKKIFFILIEAKLLQEIKTRFTLTDLIQKQNDIGHKSISGVGYRSIDVL
jgi:hypothetical protein